LSVSLPKGDLTIGVTTLMEMSFAELKILNEVGVARPSVGNFFQAVAKIKNTIICPTFLLVSVVQKCGTEYKIWNSCPLYAGLSDSCVAMATTIC